MNSNLHPVMQQALRPFMSPAQASVVSFDQIVTSIKAQKEQDRLAGREFFNQHMHRRRGKSRDDFALRLQINRPQTVEGWFL